MTSVLRSASTTSRIIRDANNSRKEGYSLSDFQTDTCTVLDTTQAQTEVVYSDSKVDHGCGPLFMILVALVGIPALFTAIVAAYYKFFNKVKEENATITFTRPVVMNTVKQTYDDDSPEGRAINLLKKMHCKVTMLGDYNEDSAAKLTERYLLDAEYQRTKGYVRVVVALDSVLIDNILSEYEGHSIDLDSYLHSKIDEPCRDAESLFDERIAELREIYDEEEWEEVMESDVDSTLSVNTNIILDGCANTLIGVDVPVDNVYDIFCYLPFGGADCPEPMDQRSVAKYWFEKCGVVPCFMSGSTLQYYTKNPLASNEAATVAHQQLAFCSDIVTQGVGSVQNLASVLEQSTIWFFWWD